MSGSYCWLQASTKSELVLNADCEGVGLCFITSINFILGKLQTRIQEGALRNCIFSSKSETGALDLATTSQLNFRAGNTR